MIDPAPAGTRHRQARRAAVAAAGLLLTIAAVLWASEGDQTGRVGGHLLRFGIAFLAYLLALWGAPALGRHGLAAALLAAVAWRAILVPSPPLLSDDVYRYVWEGRIQLHGGNPYAWADRPTADHWEGLRDGVWQGINHKDATAIYPPLFQLFARGVVTLHDSVLAMKGAVALCEVASWGVLLLVLRRRGLPTWRVLIAAWSPLALVEIAGSGHNDSLGLLLLATAVWALDGGRPLLSALAASAGVGVKFLPGLIALGWARRYRFVHAAAAGLLLFALAWPYLGAGTGLLRSASRYARLWRFNDSLFSPLEWSLGHGAAVAMAMAISLALALLLAWRRTETAAAGLLLTAVALLLSPSVLPWYALWLLPWLVLRDEPAALLFTGTVALAYLVYPAWQSGEPWHLPGPWRLLEYLPCGVVWLWSRSSRLTTRGAGRAPMPDPLG